jgi:hypothetical protein
VAPLRLIEQRREPAIVSRVHFCLVFEQNSHHRHSALVASPNKFTNILIIFNSNFNFF